LGVCGLDLTGSGQGPVAGCCECGDEPSSSWATELVLQTLTLLKLSFSSRTSERAALWVPLLLCHIRSPHENYFRFLSVTFHSS
jgi:hypothetical protein